MTTEEMSQKIIDHVRRHGDASFADLMRMFGDEARGDLALEIRPNAVLWSGMSQALIDALDSVKQHIEPRGTSVPVYFADGSVLDMPIARSLPKAGFKRPRWLPVVLVPRQPGQRGGQRKARG